MAVEEIHAEMVSSVWKVLVAPGEQVAADAPLVILESMKMEIPVQEGDLIATVVDG